MILRFPFSGMISYSCSRNGRRCFRSSVQSPHRRQARHHRDPNRAHSPAKFPPQLGEPPRLGRGQRQFSNARLSGLWLRLRGSVRRGRAFGHRGRNGLRRRRSTLGSAFAFRKEDRHDLPDGDLVALLGADVRQGSRSRSFELEYRLVGFDLHHGLTLFYELSLGLEPAHENAAILGHLDRRHDDFNCHGSSLAPEHLPGDPDNALSIRNCLVFQSRSERNRYIHRCYAPHRGVKMIKRLLDDDRAKLGRLR